MTVLPIVERELRVAARRRSTYWVRVGTALSLLVLGTWFYLMMGREIPQRLARTLFGLITGTAMLYSLFSGLRATADCLSQEKRDGTLGLLFLTDLKGYDIVLGKLVANSVNAFYGILAVLPLLAIPVLIGGIMPEEFGRMAVVIVNTLFLSLTTGVLVSVFSRDGRKAMIATFFVLLMITALFPALAAWLRHEGKLPFLQQALLVVSPGYNYVVAFEQAPRGFGGFWLSVGVIHGLAWLFLAVASLFAPFSWQDRGTGRAGAGFRNWFHRLRYGGTEYRAELREQLLGVNAFYWLSSRVRLKPALPWLILLALAGLWVWGLIKIGSEWLNSGIYVTTAIVLNLLIKGWVASESGRQLAEERQQGTLELLLSTPLKVSEITTGQRLALQRQFLGPVVLVLVLAIIFMTAGRSEMSSGEDRGWWTFTWGAAMVMFVADLVAIHWVGMWQGMTARNYNRAAQGTIMRILVLPWVAFALVMLVISLGSLGTGGGGLTWGFLVILWLLLGLGANLGFGFAARNRMFSEFRATAAQRFETPQSFWKRWLG